MEGVMKKSIITASLAAASLSGCYVVPLGSDQVDKLVRMMEQQNAGMPAPNSMPFQPATAPRVAPAPVAAAPMAAQGATQPKPGPSLPARLYPINDIATENGMVAGTVTSTTDGKARFQFNYRGESLVGEATRVSGDDRKGVATAWAPSGAFMTCEYQMSSIARGAGTCSFSDGARYQVHVGN
jgi:hypothetical protein